MEVTIGLPVYNAEEYIEDCIRSILNQTYSSFKLLIIDDGSTDNSIQIIEKFIDPRIELIIDGENKGLPNRLNQLARMCDTTYLARMDSDDIMHKERIEKQFKILKSRSDIDVVGTNAYIIDAHNNITGIRLPYDKNMGLKRVSNFIHPTVFAKREWFLSNPYNERLKRSQDSELWERTRNRYTFTIINSPLLFYREFGSTYYKKYWRNLKSKGVLLGKYFKLPTIPKFLKYFFKEYLKTLVTAIAYSIAALFKAERVLISRRSHKMNKLQQEIAGDNLKDALT